MFLYPKIFIMRVKTASFRLCITPIAKLIRYRIVSHFLIGVDDIYVIVQAVDNLTHDEKKLPANERVAKAMKHAGVSITVTSITDMAALLISSTTVSINCLGLTK